MKSPMYERPLSPESAIALLTEATILDAEPVNYPRIDGWQLLIKTKTGEVRYIKFDDLMNASAEPDRLKTILAIRATKALTDSAEQRTEPINERL